MNSNNKCGNSFFLKIEPLYLDVCTMSNINNTEAAITNDALGNPHGSISILSGTIGDEYVKLYNFEHPDYDGNIQTCPYIGFSFSAYASNFNLFVCSIDKSYLLYKGDMLRIKFENDVFINLKFLVGGFQVGKEKRNVLIPSEREIIQFKNYPISHVEISNYKTGSSSIYKFSRQQNNQYKDQFEGSELLQIVVQRIVGLKMIIGSLPK